MNKRNQTHAKPALSHVDAWEELAMDYLDGRLSAVDSAMVEAHLQSCSTCRDAIKAQNEVMTITRAVPEAALPPGLSARILDALTAGAATPVATDAIRRAKMRDAGLLRRFMDRLVHAPWAPAAVALLVVAVGVAAWGGFASQTNRGTAGSPRSFAVTTTQEAGDKTAATATQETGPRNGDDVTTGGAGTTAAAATTTVTVGTGTTQMVTTAGTLHTSSVTTQPPQATTLINPSTTRTAEGMMAALGLTPILLTVSVVGIPPAGGIAGAFQEVAGMQPLPKDLWFTEPMFAAVMGGSDVEVMREQLRLAGLETQTEDAGLIYGQDYLDRVAGELGLSYEAGKDTLVIAVLIGK